MLEDSFLIIRCVRYDIKGRKYIDTPQKYYFEDLGLRNACIGFRQVEETHLMENLIYNELRICGYLVDVGVVPTRVKDADGAIAEASWRLILCAIVVLSVYMYSLLIDCLRRKSANRKWQVC